MITVGNVEFAIAKLVSEGGFSDPPPGPDDVVLSYLPLCHVAERTATTWVGAEAGAQVHFAESIETVQAEPQGGPADDLLRGAAHLGEDPRGDRDPDVLRLAVQAWNYGFWMKVAEKIGDELVATDGQHTRRTTAAVRHRLPVPVPRAAGPARSAQVSGTPAPAPPRSLPRCCGSSWASA